MNQYPIYKIEEKLKQSIKNKKEKTGYLPKFWVNHPKLGSALVKLEQNEAPAWTEVATYQIARKLGLPAARYELADYIDGEKATPAVISPSFRYPNLNTLMAIHYLETSTAITFAAWKYL